MAENPQKTIEREQCSPGDKGLTTSRQKAGWLLAVAGAKTTKSRLRQRVSVCVCVLVPQREVAIPMQSLRMPKTKQKGSAECACVRSRQSNLCSLELSLRRCFDVCVVSVSGCDCDCKLFLSPTTETMKTGTLRLTDCPASRVSVSVSHRHSTRKYRGRANDHAKILQPQIWNFLHKRLRNL